MISDVPVVNRIARRATYDVGQRGGALVGVLVLSGLLGLGAFGWWFSQRADDAVTLDPARMITVKRTEVIDAVTAAGRVEPLARVAVMSRASGIIEALYVEEGDEVKAGQLLAELDKEQLAANLAQDRADLASAEARVSGAEGRLAEARVRLEDPERQFVEREAHRLQLLFDTGDVSLKERDDALKAAELVAFRLAQVRANLIVLQASLAESQANMLSAQAAVKRSETALQEATIRCPMDGVVLVRDKEVGDGVSSLLTAGGNATQIMVLGDLSEMFIEARIDEVDLGRIFTGMPVRLTTDAFRGQELPGIVDRIAPAGSVDNNGIVTFEVRITVEDTLGLLRPDMTADAKLILAADSDALVLPQRALSKSVDGSWTVQKVIGDGANASTEETVVGVGISDGLMTQIVSGLAEGEQVYLGGVTAPRIGGRR
ncbi:MAG: HlyD family secretion protein [Pseudohongiellaceae bacterium]|jgi:HlyD family secretion protein